MQGIVASGIVVITIAYCVDKRGPLFASIFGPLVIVLVAIVGSLALDEKLYLGRYSPPYKRFLHKNFIEKQEDIYKMHYI